MSHSTGNCFVSIVSDNPLGSSPIRMISGASSVSLSSLAANSGLQAAIKARGAELGIAVNAPPPVLCTDNAAMAASAAYYAYERGETTSLDMDCYASEPLGPRE